MAWRIERGPLQARPLTLRELVSHRQLKAAMNTYKEFTPVKATVRLLEQTVLGAPQALVVRWHPAATDPELQAAVDAWKKPHTLVDPVLGTLTHNRAFGSFEATITIGTAGQRTVRFAVTARGEEPDGEELAVGRGLAPRLAAVEAQLGRWATAALYNTWLDNWREDDTASLTRDEFAARIKLREVAAGGERITFWCDDAGLFHGHAIEVRCRPDGTLIECCLAG